MMMEAHIIRTHPIEPYLLFPFPDLHTLYRRS
jgi:hypothetical protein